MTLRSAVDSTPDQRRDQMLVAAAVLIAERGFSETRIADVAERVGASPALVIYYFGTKDRLLTEALRYSEQTFYAAAENMLARTLSLRRRLEILVGLTCVPQGDDDALGSWGLWFDLWAQAFRQPQVKQDRIELDQRWRTMIQRVVEDAIRTKEVVDVDAEEFAITFSCLLDGLSIQVALKDPVVDAERALRIGMRFASRELGFEWKPRRAARSAGSRGRRGGSLP
ncbi:MAG: TetR/AcrR family transcriptional regulator [Nocardioidaceae bacterium]